MQVNIQLNGGNNNDRIERSEDWGFGGLPSSTRDINCDKAFQGSTSSSISTLKEERLKEERLFQWQND
ncbi:hypothetical protein H4I96_06099 [Botrytis cinerea]